MNDETTEPSGADQVQVGGIPPGAESTTIGPTPAPALRRDIVDMIARAKEARSESESSELIETELRGTGAFSTLFGVPAKVQPNVLPGVNTKWSAGLYLVTGGTGGGKTILSYSLSLLALASARYRSVGYIYAYEARAGTSYGQAGERNMFTDPAKFFDDLDNVPDIDALKGPGETGEAGAPYTTRAWLVIDSLGLPMRLYNSAARSGQGAGEKGMSIEDMNFCARLTQWALERGVVVIGIVSTDLVPFVSKLEGVTEGLINVVNATTFKKRDRIDRTNVTLSVPQEAVNRAASVLGYSPRSTPSYDAADSLFE